MNQDPFRQFQQSLMKRGAPGPGGLFAGSGLLIALAVGGFALNASLFNGPSYFNSSLGTSLIYKYSSGWWS